MTQAHFDKAPCGYFSFYDDGTISVVNETLCALLGYTKEELVNANVESLFTLPTRIFYQTHFFPLLKMQSHAEEIFISLRTKSGDHLPVLLNAKREAAPQPYTACVFIVVVNRKKFEDELVAARKEAENSLKENTALQKIKEDLQKRSEQLDAQFQIVSKQNSELKQLNHVITHSLKEPLRKMMLFAEKLNRYEIPVEATETLSRLSVSSVQMRDVVVGLQQYVWLNDSPALFVPLNLEEIAQAVVMRIKQESGTDALLIQTDLLPVIDGDKEQIEVLFYHLLSNAIKFKNSDKAHVTITASIIQQNRFVAIEDKYHYDDFVKLQVTDKGIGFDPASAEAVFELFKKFHTTDGPGLGLALCKKIVANHHGTVKAESKLGVGTTITIILPVTQKSEQGKP